MPTKHASTSTTFPKTKLLQLSYFSRIAEMTELTQLCIAKRFSVFPSLSGAGHDLPPPDPPYPPPPPLTFLEGSQAIFRLGEKPGAFLDI